MEEFTLNTNGNSLDDGGMEKLTAFLLKLSDAVKLLSNPVDIEALVTRITMDCMDADRCYYAVIEEDNVKIVRDAMRGDLPSVAGVYSISSFPKFKALLNAGQPFIVDDVRTTQILDEELKQLCIQLQHISFINVPAITNGKPVGLLSLVQGRPRKWTDAEVQLATETAERTWATIERTKAAQVSTKTEEQLRAVLEQPEENREEVLFNNITERKQAEEKIKESEHRFHELIYSSPSMMAILKGDDMIIEIANDAVLTSWGKGKDVIGKSIFLVLPEVVEQGFDKLLRNVYKTGEPFHAYETPVTLLRNGISEIIYYNFVYQAQRNVHGEIEGVAILASEVTPQALLNKKIKASEEKFKQLVIQAPVAICVLRGEDYVIETMNEGMSVFWDRTVEQALNKPVFDVLPEVRNQGIKELLDNVYFTGERCVVEELCIEIMRNGRLENAFVKFVYEPLREADGSISGVMALAHEITEQVVARKKVEESEKQFEAAILAVEGVIWTNNANGEMIGKQPGWAKLTGQDFEEYQGYGWTNAIHPDDAQPTVEAWNKAVATSSTFEYEHRVKTRQNVWRLFSVKAVPAFDENGAIQQWVGVHTDITEQKLAQEKLAYRTALLEAHNEASVDGLLLVDTNGKILSFNQRFVDIWNMPPHIVNDKDDDAALLFAMSQLVTPQQFIDKVKYLYEHPTETSLDELELKNGKLVERNGYSVIGEDGTYYAWSWTFKDLTERKKIEQDLKNTKEQLELTFKNIPAGVYLINAKAEMVYVNDRGAAVYGDFTPEYMLEHKDLSTQLKIADELFERFDENGNYFSAQDSPAFISLTTGKPSQAILKQINKLTREQRWYYVQGAPLFDERGNVSLVLITSTDITEQKNAEEKIKYSEVRFRSLAETLPQMVWVMNGDGEMEYGSKNWAAYSGIDDVAEAWNYMMHPNDRERLTAYWNQVFASGEGYQHEVRLKSKEGVYRWFYSVGEPVLDADKKVIKWVGSLTDINEQKLKDERKDEFISIASHELKTPLTTAKAYLQMLEIYLDENNEEAALYVKKANQAVNRLNELIGELLDVSKISLGKINYNISAFNFNDMIDSTVENIQLISPKHTIVKTGKVYDIVTGDKDRLQQVVINLLTNAIKYSPESDKVFITLEQQNDTINVSVRDTGIGIAKQSLHKIFEKYHRIEEHAVHFQGLGIGLYISYEIIRRHHGKLWAESEPGKGSIFYFSLPVRHVDSDAKEEASK